jgi:hypothetical protein
MLAIVPRFSTRRRLATASLALLRSLTTSTWSLLGTEPDGTEPDGSQGDGRGPGVLLVIVVVVVLIYLLWRLLIALGGPSVG